MTTHTPSIGEQAEAFEAGAAATQAEIMRAFAAEQAKLPCVPDPVGLEQLAGVPGTQLESVASQGHRQS